jgi:hypothetical protein
VENYPAFLKICIENLSPHGAFLIATKAYYYGNEGGIAEFVNFIHSNSQGKLDIKRIKKIGMGSGNRREIISVEWVNL